MLREEIFRLLRANPEGLEESAVLQLRARFGSNELPERRRSLLRLFFRQFQSVVVAILLVAAALSAAMPLLHASSDATEWFDAAAILAIVFLNAIFGFAQEWKAENAIAQLKRLSAPVAKVRRNGTLREVPSRDVVPGDVLVVDAGDRLSADARLVASASLEVDESSLTGESLAAAKRPMIELEASTGTSAGMLYAGTLVTRGSGEAVITGTGLSTQIGTITKLMLTLEQPPTPLSVALQHAGRNIGLAVLALCLMLFGIGLWQSVDVFDLFFTLVSLSVAAVPEGLPAIATVCLAIGVQRMARRRALVRKMDAVETLGAVTVICADKTGTITENRMQVREIWTPDGSMRDRALLIAASCNRAELPDIGDPTELGLLRAAAASTIQRLEILEEPVPFTSEAKYMATLHADGSRRVRFLKGAPEVLAAMVSPSESSAMLQEAQRLSDAGRRVLAVAEGPPDACRIVGLVAMIDPPRAGADRAIRTAAEAGIRTFMITGDHPATALAIAKSVGIISQGVLTGADLRLMDDASLSRALTTVRVFARVQPEDKVRILMSLQSSGDIVCMSGDGVNDAPALRRAHVGVGMGLRGTAVAREAASIVLTDDDISTIVTAIEEGRRVYDNIRKFVLYLMRGNAGEMLIIACAIALRMPLPLLPLHILWINLVTDSLPALALAMEPAESNIMRRPPRSQHDGLFAREWPVLVFLALVNAVLALGSFSFVLWLGEPLSMARSTALAVTIVCQIALAFSTRTHRSAFFITPLQNRWLASAATISILCHLALLSSPLAPPLGLAPLTVFTALIASAAAFTSFLASEFLKFIRRVS